MRTVKPPVMFFSPAHLKRKKRYVDERDTVPAQVHILVCVVTTVCSVSSRGASLKLFFFSESWLEVAVVPPCCDVSPVGALGLLLALGAALVRARCWYALASVLLVKATAEKVGVVELAFWKVVEWRYEIYWYCTDWLLYVRIQEPLNPRTYHGKIRISTDGRFWPLLLQWLYLPLRAHIFW
jgi:hypothetical protein